MMHLSALALAVWIGVPPFWPLTALVGSRPTAIVRDFVTGHLYYEACQARIGPDGVAVIIHCGGSLNCFEPCPTPPAITLADWCQVLKALPVPPKFRATDEDSLYARVAQNRTCPP